MFSFSRAVIGADALLFICDGRTSHDQFLINNWHEVLASMGQQHVLDTCLRSLHQSCLLLELLRETFCSIGCALRCTMCSGDTLVQKLCLAKRYLQGPRRDTLAKQMLQITMV